MAHFYPVLWFLFLHTCLSEVDSPGEVEAEVGGDAILPCNLNISLDKGYLSVKWKHEGMNVHFYRNGADGNPAQDTKFKNRTSLFDHELDKGNTSLKLTNVTEQDVGLYTCDIHYTKNSEKGSKKCNVRLKPMKSSDRINETDNSAKTGVTGNGDSSNIVIAVIVVVLIIAVVIAIAGSVVRKKCRNRDGVI